MKVLGQVCSRDLTGQRRLLEGDNVIAAHEEGLGIGLAEDMEKRLGCPVKQSWYYVGRKGSR